MKINHHALYDPNSSAWIQTFSGRQFFPLRPLLSSIHIEDIAHALSNICRFTGHCREFYSVAQHSVLCSRELPNPLRLWGLLHDASEAYLCDLAKPIKDLLPSYRELESRLMKAIAERYGLGWPMPAMVHEVDMSMLLTERRDLLAESPAAWDIPGIPYDDVFVLPWKPHEAKRIFLQTYKEVVGL